MNQVETTKNHPFASYDPTIPVSAIEVNWNGREHLEVCLKSLLGQTLSPVEVVLVDNGSTDGSVEFVRQRFGSTVRTVVHDTNLDYGKALNAGMQVANGRYLVALNNDTEVAAECLSALVGAPTGFQTPVCSRRRYCR